MSEEAVADVPAAQVRLVAEKVAAITMKSDGMLDLLKLFFASPEEIDYPIVESSRGQAVSVHMCARIAQLPYTAASRLKLALEQSDNEECTIVHALTLYPSGRELLSKGKTVLAQLNIIGTEISDITLKAKAVMALKAPESSELSQTVVDHFVDEMFALNEHLFNFERRDAASVPKDIVLKECDVVVRDARKHYTSTLVPVVRTTLIDVMSPKAGEAEIALHQAVNIWLENTQNAKNLFAAPWGWDETDCDAKVLKAITQVDTLGWQYETWTSAEQMKPDKIHEVTGILNDARTGSSFLSETWGEEFKGAWTSWQASNGVQLFEESLTSEKKAALQESLADFRASVVACFEQHSGLRSTTFATPKVAEDFAKYSIPEPALAKAMHVAAKVREQGSCKIFDL